MFQLYLGFIYFFSRIVVFGEQFLFYVNVGGEAVRFGFYFCFDVLVVFDDQVCRGYIFGGIEIVLFVVYNFILVISL